MEEINFDYRPVTPKAKVIFFFNLVFLIIQFIDFLKKKTHAPALYVVPPFEEREYSLMEEEIQTNPDIDTTSDTLE